MSTNDGGYAFPQTIMNTEKSGFVSSDELDLGGMSLRDWFAGMALQGWLSAYKGTTHPVTSGLGSSFASNAYAMADEMLKAREAK